MKNQQANTEEDLSLEVITECGSGWRKETVDRDKRQDP